MVQAAAAFRRAGQDALANELDQAAKVQRPPTPVARQRQPRTPGGAGAPLAAADAARRRGREAPAELEGAQRAPTRGSGPGARRGGRARGAATPTSQPGAVDPPSAARGRGGAAAVVRAGAARAGAVAVDPGRRASGWRSPTRPTRAPTRSSPARARSSGSRASGARRVGAAPSRWGARAGAPFFRLTGGGEIWIAGATNRWLPLRLADDVLYVREDRVLAFEGSLTWEAGAVAEHGLRMLQFRGRGTVALELPTDAIAIKVTDEKPTLLSAARLYGWVGRLVPHGARMPGDGAVPARLSGRGRGLARGAIGSCG